SSMPLPDVAVLDNVALVTVAPILEMVEENPQPSAAATDNTVETSGNRAATALPTLAAIVANIQIETAPTNSSVFAAYTGSIATVLSNLLFSVSAAPPSPNAPLASLQSVGQS